jgi:hypothetical protein
MTSTAPDRSGSGTPALLALLWVGWFLVPPVLFLAAMAQMPWFSAESPTVAQEAAADRYLVAAVLAAIAVPLIGVVVSLRTARGVHAVVFGVALTIGALLAVPVLGEAQDDRWNPDAPARPVCQEHSGGDNRCPGG